MNGFDHAEDDRMRDRREWLCVQRISKRRLNRVGTQQGHEMPVVAFDAQIRNIRSARPEAA